MVREKKNKNMFSEIYLPKQLNVLIQFCGF